LWGLSIPRFASNSRSFSRDNQLVYRGHNAYRSYERVEGDDGDTDDNANIRDEDEGDGSNERGVCDERAGSNERGVCDEDQDGVPSTTVQPLLHTIMIEVLKGRVLTHQ